VFELIVLVPALPLASFLAITALGRRLGSQGAAWVACASTGIAAVISTVVAVEFIGDPPDQGFFAFEVWEWLRVGGLRAPFALHLDALSVIMTSVVTGVGFLIHLYSAEFMAGEEGYSRFFSWLNLFVGFMLVLVLAGNFVVLYLGWEGVGLCSYLLIGFWYRNPANGAAARKAFIVTRIGDVAMALGLLLIFTDLGTLDIREAMNRSAGVWPVGSDRAVAAAALLLAGAAGKSAQIPLQVWLPDAMAGPTPVSALIHAATMVTAGVYLVARTHWLFVLAPDILLVVATLGSVTMLAAGLSACVQTDIKRTLAYSTISQLGYMFLALGVGAWSAGVFHFMTHAFFKALLFLAAGAVILATQHEHDMRKLGGLARQMPFVFVTFLAGAASLAALPVLTAGFYSKDMILAGAWAAPEASRWFLGAALAGAFVTSFYSFRMVFLTFLGPARMRPHKLPGFAVGVPLGALALLSLGAGLIEIPHSLGHVSLFSSFLADALPYPPAVVPAKVELALQATATGLALAGLAAAWVVYVGFPWAAEWHATMRPLHWVHGLLRNGWGFDAVYDRVLVRPFVAATSFNRNDLIDSVFEGVGRGVAVLHVAAALTQTGRVRWYAALLAIGVIALLAVLVLP